MKTQIDISDPLHFRAKVYAACNKTTLAALVNEGLASLLARKQAKTGNPLKLRNSAK